MAKRTFLVTGASKGIGRSLSERLARAGHHVVGLARSRTNFPGDLVQVDLSNRGETTAVLDSLTNRYVFDGVVNNVGLVRPQRLGEIKLDDLDEVLAVNLHSAVQAVQAALTRHAAQSLGPHRQYLQFDDTRHHAQDRIRGGKGRAGQLRTVVGPGTSRDRDNGQCRCAWAYRDGALQGQQPTRK